MRNRSNLTLGTLFLMIGIGLLAFMLCGCTIWKTDKITNLTETGIGLKASYSGTGIMLGFFRAKQTVLPVSSNQLYTARFFDTVDHINTIAGQSFKFAESEGAGDVGVGTNATGGAIIPKLPLGAKRP